MTAFFNGALLLGSDIRSAAMLAGRACAPIRTRRITKPH